ncbi:type II toxin-antitoxin system VapC family toxin [soil metagenome]
MAWYVDTSALVKLVVAEPETVALRGWLATREREPIACDLVRTELSRTVRRVAPDRLATARAVLDALTLTTVTSAVFESAGRLDPSILTSLDAIHLAAALDLCDDLEGMVTYDDRLGDAARRQGIGVVSPN